MHSKEKKPYEQSWRARHVERKLKFRLFFKRSRFNKKKWKGCRRLTLANKEREKSLLSANWALQSHMVSPVAKVLPGKLNVHKQPKKTY